jgi:succinoglycan biosynthesis protein ExoM
MSTKNSVCIAVCTFKRPGMLLECLNSLSMLTIPGQCSVAVVVIDNEQEPNNRDIVCGFPGFLYVHEPLRGISNARNAALQAAFSVAEDWIAFIDDDEVADRFWLSRLLSKAEESKVDVIGGPVAFHYPENYPAYLERRKWRFSPNAPTVTSNVLISMNFLRKFDPTPSFDRNLAAGEDRAFFTLLRENGAVFERADNAIVTETAVVSRYSLWGCIKRGYNGGKRRARERGKRVAFTSALRLLVGPLKVALSPLAMLGGIQAFTTVCYAGFRTTASGVGAISGLFGAEPVFYRDIDGY